MRLIDADVLKQHIDKLPALPDGNFAGNHSALKALINMQPTIESSTNCSEIPNVSDDTISRQAAIEAIEAEKTKRGDYLTSSYVGYEIAEKVVAELPPAEPKTGKWILDRSGAYCCSKCMEPCATYVMMKPRDKYCKMCGSRNEVTT